MSNIALASGKASRSSFPIPTTCEACGGTLKKLLSAPAVQFKGSGFYLTDYGRSGSDAKSGGRQRDDGSSAGESKPSAEPKPSADAKAATEAKPAKETKGGPSGSGSGGDASPG